VHGHDERQGEWKMSVIAENRPGYLWPDLLGACYITAAVAFLVTQPDLVAAATKAHPYAMGFAKFAVLATFGECLKHRLITRTWIPSKIVLRCLIWGVFGMWITATFPFMDGGLRTLASAGIWPSAPAPFWMSTWINVFSGFGFFMMFSHYWTDAILAEGWVAPWTLFGRPATARWAKIVLISLVVFWIPAHTLTFALAAEWRIVCAAFLGIALGLILSFAARTK
jgi:hypothetical protein